MNQLSAIFRFRAFAIPLLFVMGLVGPSPVSAAQRLRDGDSIWEVSTRRLKGCPAADAQVTISRWIECQFYASTLDAFLADPVAQAAPRTIIYVHGNWMEHDNARERGLAIYKMLSKQTTDPIRMILFSWPSEREGRIAPDVREKANLAHIESCYLADFLKHVPQDRPLSLLGFSFGGAVISGTLQLLAGGSLDGRSLPQSAIAFPSVRVSFIAPAFDRKQFLENGKYNRALQIVDRLVNLYNSQDPVLKRFRFIDRGAPVAAGFLGLDPHIGRPLQSDPKIVQYDCSKSAGRTHFELDYYKECAAIKHSLGNVLGY
jgi:Alpha/beta hydrolase of unknown function (DUF900)